MITKITIHQNATSTYHATTISRYDNDFSKITHNLDLTIKYYQDAKMVMEKVSSLVTDNLTMGEQLTLVKKAIESVEWWCDYKVYTKKRWSVSTKGMTIWIENN